MSAVLEHLLTLLQLEQLEVDLFRGQSQDLGFGALFGGQVLGQALSAASQSVEQTRGAHSLHGYFLRPGDSSKPIVYHVERVRDGVSFSTRRVVAMQGGRPICTVAASFHAEEAGFCHQSTAPDVPKPDTLESELAMAQRLKNQIPEPLLSKLLSDKPIEIRPVNPVNPFAPEVREPIKCQWLRAVAPLPDDEAVHKYLLAYASDFGLVSTSLYPHARTFWEPSMQVASIDHAMWFHRPVRMDQWLLHVMDSPSACCGLGLNRGSIFTEDGILVASVVQEGLIRDRAR